YGPFQMAFGICLGLLWPTRHQAPAQTASRAGPTLVALLLVAGVAFTALDYHRMRQIYLLPEERAAAYQDNTLEKVRAARVFRDQVRFAELTTTPLRRDNAEWTYVTAMSLLPFSPEPRVIEKVIESAVMLGRDDTAVSMLARYRAAFPKEHAEWAAALKPAPLPPFPGAGGG
ncbi:MAG: Wzy polymerase domain-containing protein, partial [Burkholderiaceae bacterium]